MALTAEMRQTFERARRLRKRVEFTRVQSSGQRWSSRHFVFLLSLRNDGERLLPSRLGLVVSTRVGCAVQRNRIKRLCRELFRTSVRQPPCGLDLVVIAKAGAGETTSELLGAEWRQAERPLAQKAEALARTRESGQSGVPKEAPPGAGRPPR